MANTRLDVTRRQTQVMPVQQRVVVVSVGFACAVTTPAEHGKQARVSSTKQISTIESIDMLVAGALLHEESNEHSS